VIKNQAKFIDNDNNRLDNASKGGASLESTTFVSYYRVTVYPGK